MWTWVPILQRSQQGSDGQRRAWQDLHPDSPAGPGAGASPCLTLCPCDLHLEAEPAGSGQWVLPVSASPDRGPACHSCSVTGPPNPRSALMATPPTLAVKSSPLPSHEAKHGASPLTSEGTPRAGAEEARPRAVPLGRGSPCIHPPWALTCPASHTRSPPPLRLSRGPSPLRQHEGQL